MGGDKQERERKFIREKIVPRKKYKKILGIIGAVLGASVLFGASAGAVFYLMQETLKRNEAQESPSIEAIIIARDDISVSPESGETGEAETAQWSSETRATEKAPSSSETPPSTPEPETDESLESTESESEDDSTPAEDETGSEDTPEAESGSESIPETETRDETEPAESGSESEEESASESGSTETDDPGSSESESGGTDTAQESTEAGESLDRVPTLPERALDIRKSTVRISALETGATDWLSAAIREKRELYGVIAAENSEYVLVLTNAVGLDTPETEITIQVDGVSCPAEFQKADSISGLTILRAEKEALADHYEVIPLGNSLTVSVADPVWFSGFSPEAGNGLNEGSVSYIEEYRPTVDGYVQKISTGMLHYPGEQGILLNENNELIGLVSDDSCTEGVILTAWGISPLKYLLEDMCSGAGTAYLGIRCRDVSADEAEALGIPSGLYIQEVTPDSPAYDAGFLPGDRLVRVDAGSVNTNHMLLLWMDIVEPYREITVGIERRGPSGYEPLEIPVTPGERR